MSVEPQQAREGEPHENPGGNDDANNNFRPERAMGGGGDDKRIERDQDERDDCEPRSFGGGELALVGVIG